MEIDGIDAAVVGQVLPTRYLGPLFFRNLQDLLSDLDSFGDVAMKSYRLTRG